MTVLETLYAFIRSCFVPVPRLCFAWGFSYRLRFLAHTVAISALTTFYNRSVKFDKFISVKNFFSRWLRQLLLPHRKCERESQGVWSINCFVWRGCQTTGANYFTNGMEGTSVLPHGSREEQLNIKICNLFTHGTPRSSQEFVQNARAVVNVYAYRPRDVGVRVLVLSCTCNQTHH